MAVEVIEVAPSKKIEYRFCALCHLMIAYEQGSRSYGQTVIEGLPPSSVRELKKKLATFDGAVAVSDRHRIGVGLQRLKFIQHGLSQGNWVLSHRLPSSPGLGANEFGRMARRAPCIA